MPNGSWWLLRWYAAMTGHTVRVTPPAPPAIDTLSGLASLDTGERQARVIVANPAGGAARVALTGIDPGVFGERVRVLVQAASWTGYDGSAFTPLDLAATEYPVTGGQVAVDLDAMDPMTAYQLIVSPGGIPPRADGPERPEASGKTQSWTAQYLAAEATLTGFRSHEDLYATLSAGTHVITFGVSELGIGTAKSQVTLNVLKLAYAPTAVPGVTIRRRITPPSTPTCPAVRRSPMGQAPVPRGTWRRLAGPAWGLSCRPVMTVTTGCPWRAPAGTSGCWWAARISRRREPTVRSGKTFSSTCTLASTGSTGCPRARRP
jgi:hypothetical protein